MRKIEEVLPEEVGRVSRARWFLAVVAFVAIGGAIGGWLSGVAIQERTEREARIAAAWEDGLQLEREAEERAEAERVRLEREQYLAERAARIEGKKLVALTFDDGPSRATTGRLLDILAEKNVKATFFVVGRRAQSAPELVQREAAEGHEVGSHTVTHLNMSKASEAEIVGQRDEMKGIFREILGREPVIIRPPYGNGIWRNEVRWTLGMPLIHWTVDTLDWKYRNFASIRQRTLDAVFDGAVILMHDIHPTTVDSVGAIIDELRAMGYEFLTVSELAEVRGVDFSAGTVHFGFKP